MEYRLNSSELIDKCSFSWSELYDNDADKQAFLKRLDTFIAADSAAANIIHVDSFGISYSSESYIPPAVNPDKANLVLVLGNPAPESVAMGAMFAYENHGKRHHRFWRVLDEAGLLRFRQSPDTLDPHAKMEKLYANEFDAPFNTFIVPFYSFPTPPGGEWNGVAGIRKLFGRAFPVIAAQDTERVQAFFDAYIHDGDSILAFQKDAFVALNDTQEAPVPYNYRNLLQQPAVSEFRTRNGANANLVCMLPTRLLHSGQTKGVLSRIAIGETPIAGRLTHNES